MVGPGATKRHIVSPHPDIAAAAAADSGGTGRQEVPHGGPIITENISQGQLQPARIAFSPARIFFFLWTATLPAPAVSASGCLRVYHSNNQR